MQALVDYAFDLWTWPDQESAPDEAVPTPDDEEDSVVDPPARKRRRTSAEVHGTEPKRRSARKSMSATPGTARAESMPRLASGAPVFQRDGQRYLTADERHMYIHAVDTRGEGVSKADVAKEWGVGKNEYARLKKKLAESGTLETEPKPGRQRLLSREDYLKLEKLNTKLHGNLTYEELAPKLSRELGYKVSATTIFREAKRNGWRDVAKYTRPWLEPEHKAQRRAWAGKKLNEIRDGKNPWAFRIDIDEKMFRCFTAKRKSKKSPTDLEAESNGRVRVKSKTHIPQTMFLAAVAQPDKKHKFDGRIGMYRCAKPVPAKRKSRNRPAGTIEWKDYSLTAETFMALLKENVIPDAVKKMSWAPEIVIQMDNARAHTGSNLVKEVNDYGRTLKPPVRIELQPPNSPDTNLNDLCFFSSLASAVSKQHTPNPDILAKEVTRLFDTWHTTDKLTKLWAIKTACLSKIWETEGDNDYKLPRLSSGRAGRAEGRAPRNKPR